MLKYELKKIFLKPSNRIMLLLLLIITLAGSFLAIRDVKYYREGQSPLSGPLAAKHLKEKQNKWKGPVTEDFLKRVIKEKRRINSSKEPEDTKFARSQGFQDITGLISVAFSEPGEYDYYLCNSISPEKASRLYERRISRLKKEITKIEQGLEGSFSQKERAFLLRQYNNLETPLYYEYSEGWKALLDSQYLPTLMIITTVIIAFFVSGIFSDEFRTKADSIFFSSVFGRNKAILSKIKAGFLTITIIYWAAMLLFSAIILGLLGTDGAGCMIQINFSNWTCMYNITYFQDWLLSLSGGYIGNLFILTLAMLVSAKSRSAVIAITIPFALSCVPMFLGRIPVLKDIVTFFPDMLLRINKFIGDFVFFEAFGQVYGIYSLLFPLYLLLFLAILPILYHVYNKMAVTPSGK